MPTRCCLPGAAAWEAPVRAARCRAMVAMCDVAGRVGHVHTLRQSLKDGSIVLRWLSGGLAATRITRAGAQHSAHSSIIQPHPL